MLILLALITRVDAGDEKHIFLIRMMFEVKNKCLFHLNKVWETYEETVTQIFLFITVSNAERTQSCEKCSGNISGFQQPLSHLLITLST